MHAFARFSNRYITPARACTQQSAGARRPLAAAWVMEAATGLQIEVVGEVQDGSGQPVPATAFTPRFEAREAVLYKAFP